MLNLLFSHVNKYNKSSLIPTVYPDPVAIYEIMGGFCTFQLDLSLTSKTESPDTN
jgi:hypothetical protein